MAISPEQEISATFIALLMIVIVLFSIVISLPRPDYKAKKKAARLASKTSKPRAATRAERVFGLKRKDAAKQS
jgi:hypothetical protein